jgi:UDP-4-amino-4,6-dideoxy-N-acetyl-beta-L-altrosamine N-acetyltransferase
MSFRFEPMQEHHLEQVLRWRTSPDVTRFMYTDLEYNPEQQQRWFKQVSASLTEKYWVIHLREQPIGVISLNQLDRANRKTSWGYYIGEPAARMYGALVPPYLYNFIFTELQLNKIVAEVMAGNENIMKIHRMHGYREVGVLAKHVFKNGEYHDVHLFELLQEHWDRAKFARYEAPFAL